VLLVLFLFSVREEVMSGDDDTLVPGIDDSTSLDIGLEVAVVADILFYRSRSALSTNSISKIGKDLS